MENMSEKFDQLNPAEFPIVEFSGFLNSIRCILGCPKYMFFAEFVPKSEYTENYELAHISDCGVIIEKGEIDYHEVRNYFIELIYKKISNQETPALQNLDWVLIEYYGLISTADQSDGPWNRLISQKHSFVRYAHGSDFESIVFFVEYSTFIVATYLGIKWPQI
jgi:hypothetical protein